MQGGKWFPVRTAFRGIASTPWVPGKPSRKRFSRLLPVLLLLLLLTAVGSRVDAGTVPEKTSESAVAQAGEEFLDSSAIELLVGKSVVSRPSISVATEIDHPDPASPELSSLLEGLDPGEDPAGIKWADPEDPTLPAEIPLQGNEFLDTFEEDLDQVASGTETIAPPMEQGAEP